MKKFDYCVYIGRFNPPHNGHIQTMLSALDVSTNLIIVLGSHFSPRTIRNPFTAKERELMVLSCIPNEHHSRISFVYVEDFLYQEAQWTKLVQSEVNYIVNSTNSRVGIIANRKDSSSYYIDNFRQWEHIPCDCIVYDSQIPISSTYIRECLFESKLPDIVGLCSHSVFENLGTFTKTEEYKNLKHEYDEGVKYELQYANIPYGCVNFVTVDAVVVQSGHILMIRRRNAPGRNLLALPGGHCETIETLLDGCIRELREETGLKVPVKVLKGSIFHNEVFDHPERSLRARIKNKRGRTITHAYGFKLDDSEALPKIKGSSDASSAHWYTFDEVAEMRDQIFEDHASIIDTMLARLK